MNGAWWFDTEAVAVLRSQSVGFEAEVSRWCARVGDPMAGGLTMAMRRLRSVIGSEWLPMIDAVLASRLLDDWSPADAVVAMVSAAPSARSIATTR